MAGEELAGESSKIYSWLASVVTTEFPDIGESFANVVSRSFLFINYL